MWVKICGNTRLEDCQRAAELGSDAVGFIFTASKRRVTTAQVAAITLRLPAALEKIGVFTSRNADEILPVAQEAGLTGVQLHGDFDLALTQAVREQFPADGRCRVVQVMHWWTDVPAEEQSDAFAAACRAIAETGAVDALLIDSRTRHASGGTGITFDWGAARAALDELPIRLIVAGGLRPENVQDAIWALHPWGVDVSSGVESSPGVKDVDKMRLFLQNAKP
jgi:phosphoribosylanthranilate isomerase